MTPQEVFQILHQEAACNKVSDFVVSLCSQFPTKGWSPRQMECAHSIAEKIASRRKKGSNAKHLVGLDGIREMLQRARDNGRMYPRIMLKIDGNDIKLSLSGKRAKRPGQVSVTDVSTDTWLGYILEGRITVHSQELAVALVELAYTPLVAAKKYAASTVDAERPHGNCMFCVKELTVEESISRSYGPKCADNYGLPFDKVAYRKQCGVAV